MNRDELIEKVCEVFARCEAHRIKLPKPPPGPAPGARAR